MTRDFSRNEERDGTRRILVGGCIAAAVLFVGLFGWFAVPDLFGTTDYLGRPSTGADRNTAATTVGTGVPTQREAESAIAKSDPAGTEDSSGGRARRVKQSSQSVSLNTDQREKLLAIFSKTGGPRLDRPNFELMVGTSVPRQTELADLPPEATEVLNGYWGSQYLIAGRDLVIVDQHSRRVGAIISGVQQ